MKKSIKVTFETERLLLITGRKYADLRCHICGDEALMLTVEEAAALARTTARSIYGCVEEGLLHFQETEGVMLLVCSSSVGDLAARRTIDGEVANGEEPPRS